MRSIAILSTALVYYAHAQNLKKCDSSKIAIMSVPFMQTPSAVQCGVDGLGGKPITSLFETTIASQELISKISQTSSCQIWWSELAGGFSALKPCMFLGQSVQDIGKLTLEEFLQANNKEIQNFDPNRPFDPNAIEIDTEETETPETTGPSLDIPATNTTTTIAPENVSSSIDVTGAITTRTPPTQTPPTAPKASTTWTISTSTALLAASLAMALI